MADVWAPVVGHLLLLALLPSTSSSHMVFDLSGNVYPTGYSAAASKEPYRCLCKNFC